MSLKDTVKYKKVIKELRSRHDASHPIMFMCVCGFGDGWHYDHMTAKERQEGISKEMKENFSIPEIKEFLEDEEDARLFFGLNCSASYELDGINHYRHWFGQSNERWKRWLEVEKIIDDACQKIYGVPWGKQEQKVPNLMAPIGKYKKIPSTLLNKREHLDIQELKTEEIIPYLINRPVYWEDEFVGTVMKVENFSKYLFTRRVKDPTAEWDEPDEYDKDFYADCITSLYLHEYYSDVTDKSILEFKDWIGLVIPMMNFSDIIVTDDRIILKENTSIKVKQIGAGSNWMF